MLELHLNFVGTIGVPFLLFIKDKKLFIQIVNQRPIEIPVKKLEERLGEYLDPLCVTRIQWGSKYFDMYEMDELVPSIQAYLDYRQVQLDWGFDEEDKNVNTR